LIQNNGDENHIIAQYHELILRSITRRSGVFFKLVSDSDTRFKNICLELLVIGFMIIGSFGQFS
jgi:hypothetical protein